MPRTRRYPAAGSRSSTRPAISPTSRNRPDSSSCSRTSSRPRHRAVSVATTSTICSRLSLQGDADSARRRSGLDGEQSPFLGHASEDVGPVLPERDARTYEESPDRLRHQDLSGPGHVAHPLPDGHRQPGDVVLSYLHLSGVQPRLNLQSDDLRLRSDLARTAHGSGHTTVEGGEKAIAERLDLSAAVALQGGTNQRI